MPAALDVPVIPGDMVVLAEQARQLRKVGAAVADTGTQVDTGWQALGPVYQAPESGELLNATARIPGYADRVGDDGDRAGTALEFYADRVGPIQRRLEEIRATAASIQPQATLSPYAMGSGISRPVYAPEDEAALEAMEAEVTRLVAEWRAAEEAAVSTIVSAMPPVTPGAGPSPAATIMGTIDALTKLTADPDGLLAAGELGGRLAVAGYDQRHYAKAMRRTPNPGPRLTRNADRAARQLKAARASKGAAPLGVLSRINPRLAGGVGVLAVAGGVYTLFFPGPGGEERRTVTRIMAGVGTAAGVATIAGITAPAVVVAGAAAAAYSLGNWWWDNGLGEFWEDIGADALGGKVVDAGADVGRTVLLDPAKDFAEAVGSWFD